MSKRTALVKIKTPEDKLKMYYIGTNDHTSEILDKRMIDGLEWEAKTIAYISNWDVSDVTSYGCLYAGLAYV